jgi:hypothetical protein
MSGHDDDPCLRCGRWIRLGPEARKGENPRWCGECNFDQHEFTRLQQQDQILGDPVRTKYRPPTTKEMTR